MKIRLYQLSNDVLPSARFLPLEEALKAFNTDTLPAELYELVFEGFVDCNSLEEIFTEFNLNSEKYYKGHSMSISDVVEVIDGTYQDTGKFYYCERFGFGSITFERLDANRVNSPSLSERVLNRIQRELDNFERDMKAKSTAEIYSFAYKIVFMREIKLLFESFIERGDYDWDTLYNFYNIDYPLETLYESWLNNDYNIELPIKDTIDDFMQYTLPEIIKPKMRVVICEPNKISRIAEIDNTLEAMQKTVGGYIEQCFFENNDEAVIICNEEGKINNLPLNRCIYQNGEVIDIIAGTFFICLAPSDSEDFAGLTEQLANKYCDMFKCPESFSFDVDGKIIIKEWPF